MTTIHRLDSIAEVRHVVEAVLHPKRKRSAMTAIFQNGRTFGRVPMRSLTGGRYNLRESQPWSWQPRTIREAEMFRNKREDRGKHLTRFVPSPTAPVQKPLSFHERNLIRRFGKIPHHLSAS